MGALAVVAGSRYLRDSLVASAPAVPDILHEKLQSALTGTYTLERELGGGGMRAVELGQRSSIVLAELGQHLAAAGPADAVASSDCSIASKSSTSVCASWQAIDHDTLPPP